MPGASRPRRSSSPLSQAGVTVSASSAAWRSSASCGRHSRRTASRSPWSGSISSTGASEPSAIEGWIDAVTPSAAKRGMSSGCRHCACSMRGRIACGTAANASSASRLARSPIAWTATGTPARVAARTISSSSWRVVISTPLPSSRRAVCDPSVPSMYAFT
jgi:hypothetical protein